MCIDGWTRRCQYHCPTLLIDTIKRCKSFLLPHHNHGKGNDGRNIQSIKNKAFVKVKQTANSRLLVVFPHQHLKVIEVFVQAFLTISHPQNSRSEGRHLPPQFHDHSHCDPGSINTMISMVWLHWVSLSHRKACLLPLESELFLLLGLTYFPSPACNCLLNTQPRYWLRSQCSPRGGGRDSPNWRGISDIWQDRLGFQSSSTPSSHWTQLNQCIKRL